MKRFLLLAVTAAAVAANTQAQKIIREKPTPSPTPPAAAKAPPASVPVRSLKEKVSLPATVFRSDAYGFEVGIPGSWTIAGEDFGDSLKSQGFDLSLKAPDQLSQVTRAKLNRALENVTVLLTAYRAEEGTKDAAIMRVSTEDLSAVPQIKDAVDYFDLMRLQFGTMTVPPDFKYSETQAERLGRRQFAFLDTSTTAGKKRLYAIVKGRTAIMFTISYRADEDLQAIRNMLAAGDFNIK